MISRIIAVSAAVLWAGAVAVLVSVPTSTPAYAGGGNDHGHGGCTKHCSPSPHVSSLSPSPTRSASPAPSRSPGLPSPTLFKSSPALAVTPGGEGGALTAGLAGSGVVVLGGVLYAASRRRRVRFRA